jgi:pyridoxamine 5'-phosphate oxidase
MGNASTGSGADARYQEALATFDDLLREARTAGDPEPTAMTLATSVDDRVSARIVLCKGADARGFRFFTNYDSAKGEQLAAQARVALVFHWKTLRHGVQVRVEGLASKLDGAESDAYFASRPRGSQVGAWASAQSATLADRAEFEARIDAVERRFDGAPVSRPPHWGGYVVAPELIEFWYGAEFRLHERQCYERDAQGRWSRRMLFP